jgi:hypothetical protein
MLGFFLGYLIEIKFLLEGFAEAPDKPKGDKILKGNYNLVVTQSPFSSF